MIKKMLSSVLIIAIGVCSIGCSQGPKQLDEIKKAQQQLSTAESGHIIVNSTLKTSNKTDSTITDFSYKQMASGIYQYCQEARDTNQKLIYCEVSNGEKAEQWLIGKGWEVIEPISYTQDNHHRFIALITANIDSKAVDSVTKVEQSDGVLFTLNMNPERLNATIYKDTAISLVSQTITYLINANGEIVNYTDTAIIEDSEQGEENVYSVTATLSEQNALSEVRTPDVKPTAAPVQDEMQQDMDMSEGK